MNTPNSFFENLDYWAIIKIAWQGFAPALPILLFFGAIFSIIFIFDLYRLRRRFKQGARWRTDQELLQWLRGMRPSEFEEYVADLFRRLGYRTEAVGKSHDGGVDVIAEKNGVKHYIQCKKYITSKVPVGAVRDFYGALANHLAEGRGIFVTTNIFTTEAQQFAEDKPIEMVDGFGLVRLIKKADKNSPQEKEDRPMDAKCPKCGGDLLERQSKYGKFIGCSNYPRCKYTTR